jgi:hypothetical protein
LYLENLAVSTSQGAFRLMMIGLFAPIIKLALSCQLGEISVLQLRWDSQGSTYEVLGTAWFLTRMLLLSLCCLECFTPGLYTVSSSCIGWLLHVLGA